MRLWVAAALAIVGLATWLLAARVAGPSVLRFDYWAAPLDARAYRALAARDGWSARPFDLGGGVVVRGLERRARDAAAPLILYFPGNSGTLLADSQRFLDALVGDRDWGAVFWAYRGFDGSGGVPNPESLVDDAWREYLLVVAERGDSPRRVHVVGFSLGTAVASAVAARAGDAAPATLALLAPLTAVDVGGERYETLRYLNAIRGPTLILHGAADDTLPVEGARRIGALLGNRGRLVVLPALHHFDLLGSEGALAVLRAFIMDAR